MRVIAHRGASTEFPENTPGAFRRAIELKPFGTELDIHLSADGVAVVIHDRTVDRTTNGHGDVSSLTLAELKTLDAGNGEQIPTLDEVIALVGDKLHLFLEVKDANTIELVLATMQQHPSVSWTMLSGDPAPVQGVRRRYPGVELCVGAGRLRGDLDAGARATQLESAIASAREVSAAILMVHDSAVDDTVVRRVQEAGFAIWAWTVNDVPRMAELARMGVDYLCTDDAGSAIDGWSEPTSVLAGKHTQTG